MRIDTRLSERVRKVNPSPTLSITAKAKKLKSEGKDIISFAAGEPDFDTPLLIKTAAINAINSGFTKYTDSTGIPELKQLICDKFKKDNRLNYTQKQIVVSCGAKHSIFSVMFALIDKNDEVLIPAPFWVSYPEMVNLCEGIPRFIKTSAKNYFKISADDLNKNIGAKTRLLVLNSPANPTGSVYSRDELIEIAEICASKKIFVISDEIYEKIIFDNFTHTSIASLGEDIYNLTVTVNGLSKSYSMTGWRIGYLGGPQDLVDAISNFQDHSTSNPVSISQKAALQALSMPDTFAKEMSWEFQKRRDYIAKRLDGMKKISYVFPHGTFYIFCRIAETKMDSATFCNRLLDELLIAAIPGIAFGSDDYVRLSFAAEFAQIEKGMDRLEAWLEKI